MAFLKSILVELGKFFAFELIKYLKEWAQRLAQKVKDEKKTDEEIDPIQKIVDEIYRLEDEMKALKEQGKPTIQLELKILNLERQLRNATRNDSGPI